MSIYQEYACGRMADYAQASCVYADWLLEQGDDRTAARRRLKALTARTPGLRWPRPGLLPGLTPHQVSELRKALARPFGLLVGTPGTGKTFATAAVVAWLYDRYGPEQIAACAPTGKAAVRVSEAMQAHGAELRARTIHSLLEIGRNGHDGKGWAFARTPARPLVQRFVVVDEASMLETSLAASLLEACAPGTHVLLVGDPNQLPPVGHGAPLRDLIAAGVPCGRLSEIHRNAGLIVQACARIKEGLPFEAEAGATPSPSPTRNLFLAEAVTAQQQADELSRLLSSVLPGQGLDPVWDVQVLVAVNDSGPLSRKATNARLQALLNPDGERAEGSPYRVGDKVICLKNGMYEACGETAERQHWLANGEIGRVLAVEPRRAVAEFDGARQVTLFLGGEGDSGKFDLAYAITAHKSQGSEWPAVLVLLDASPGAARVAGREWLYTAISRAKEACVLVGRLGVAHTMAKRPSLESRKTFLRELLTGQ